MKLCLGCTERIRCHRFLQHVVLHLQVSSLLTRSILRSLGMTCPHMFQKTVCGKWWAFQHKWLDFTVCSWAVIWKKYAHTLHSMGKRIITVTTEQKNERLQSTGKRYKRKTELISFSSQSARFLFQQLSATQSLFCLTYQHKSCLQQPNWLHVEKR